MRAERSPMSTPIQGFKIPSAKSTIQAVRRWIWGALLITVSLSPEPRWRRRSIIPKQYLGRSFFASLVPIFPNHVMLIF